MIQTLEVIQKAIRDALDLYEPVRLNLNTVSDIHTLSSGYPREINLISHHISKAYSEGIVEDFEVTSDVLDEILNQLGDTLYHETVGTIRGLKDNELEELALMAKHEGLSVKQEALLMSAFEEGNEFPNEVDFEQKVSGTREKYSTIGLIEVSNDTFHLIGSEWTKVYISYLYLKRFKTPFSLSRSSHSSYSNLLVTKLRDTITQKYSSAEMDLVPFNRIREISSVPNLNEEIMRFLAFIDEGNIIQLYRSIFFFPMKLFADEKDNSPRPIMFLRIYLSCAEAEDSFSLEFTAPELDSENGKVNPISIITEIIDDLKESFHLFGLSIERTEEKIVSQEYVQKFVSLLKAEEDIEEIAARFLAAYERREFELAERLATDAISVASNISEEKLVDWEISLSFVQICNGFEQEAIPRLTDIVSQNISKKSTMLATMDLAYADMENDHSKEAESALKRIANQLNEDILCNLKLSFGKNDCLRPTNCDPNYNLMDGVSIKPIAECMLAIIRAQEGDFEEAMLHVQKAKRLARNRSYPNRVEARVRILKGDNELAKLALTRAKNLEPSDEVNIDAEQMVLYSQTNSESF